MTVPGFDFGEGSRSWVRSRLGFWVKARFDWLGLWLRFRVDWLGLGLRSRVGMVKVRVKARVGKARYEVLGCRQSPLY